jgi:hypothetical protein
MQNNNFSMSVPFKNLLDSLNRNRVGSLEELKRFYHKQNSPINDGDSCAFLDRIFLQAILQRFDPSPNENHEHLYLQKSGVSQIRLFDLLINHFPMVSVGHKIANEAIKHTIADCRHAALIDVGIGRGLQTVKLIESLAGDTRLKGLTIIGVELDSEALSHSENEIVNAGKKAGIKVNFVPLLSHAEELNLKTLQAALPSGFEKLAVNASLALHHMPRTDQRIALFRMMRELDPDVLMLTEPDSNHMEPNWPRRVENAYRIFGAVFSMIDQIDGATEPEKQAMKTQFFGREIMDIVGFPDDKHVECHQTRNVWSAYAQNAGFVCKPPTEDVPIISGVDFHQDPDGPLSMSHKGVPVIAIFKCERPPRHVSADPETYW